MPIHSSDISQFDMTAIETEQPEAMLGYSVRSTAQINVEEEPPPIAESVMAKIRKVARFLVESDAPEVVISIHGYGTQRSDAIDRYKKMYNYAVKICQPKTHVFFGYLWPSEKPSGDPSIEGEGFSNKLKYAFDAFPVLPSKLFFGGLALSLLTSLLLLVTNTLNWLLTPILFLSAISFALFLTLLLLRLSTYFRDNYRASNYGVLDLVELIRQIDQAVYKAIFVDNLNPQDIPDTVLQTSGITVEQWQAASSESRIDLWDKITDTRWKAETIDDKEDDIAKKLKKIKLSFIGHSMGCFVVTNAVRVLSDVFDLRAVEGTPTPEIGRVFCLGRLVLVAPDIPVETIMPRRANFLRSSLLRCEEAYVFCNEGDLALRLASTAANYFSFPAKTRSSGYRLGNVTARRFDDKNDRNNRSRKDQDYGIVNLEDGQVESPFDWLEIRASDEEHQLLNEIRDRSTIKKESTEKLKANAPISDLFTYFDCTDYLDYKGDDPSVAIEQGTIQGVVSFAVKKSALTLIDYIALSLAFFFSKPRYINVHGGYFDGIFSQQAIYRIAFTGFNEFLRSFDSDGKFAQIPFTDMPIESRQALLEALASKCQDTKIQVVLSPVRYKKNILGEP
jgi:hypothetical protein